MALREDSFAPPKPHAKISMPDPALIRAASAAKTSMPPYCVLCSPSVNSSITCFAPRDCARHCPAQDLGIIAAAPATRPSEMFACPSDVPYHCSDRGARTAAESPERFGTSLLCLQRPQSRRVEMSAASSPDIKIEGQACERNLASRTMRTEPLRSITMARSSGAAASGCSGGAGGGIDRQPHPHDCAQRPDDGTVRRIIAVSCGARALHDAAHHQLKASKNAQNSREVHAPQVSGQTAEILHPS